MTEQCAGERGLERGDRRTWDMPLAGLAEKLDPLMRQGWRFLSAQTRTCEITGARRATVTMEYGR